MVATADRRYERRARFDIVEEHFEEADFIYAQRALLLQSWDNDLAALARWDERLLAHLDGLLTAEADSTKLVLPKLVAAEAGEAFAAAYTVLASPDNEWVELLARMYFDAAQDSVLDGLCGALKLAPGDDNVRAVVAPWLGTTHEALRAAALDVLSFRRDAHVLAHLGAACADAHPDVRAAACNAVGRMRYRAALAGIEPQLDAAEPEVRFAAVRAGTLLGSARALQRCRAGIAQRDPMAGGTLRLLGRVGASADLALTLSVLDEPDLTLAAIDALGWFGDPGAVDVLLRYLDLPQWTTATAQSIQRITGVNFAAEQLLAEPPAAASGADEAAEIAASTPRPDADKMRAWWSARQNRCGAGERYFAGQACNAPTLCAQLASAPLAERDSIAYMLALQDEAAPYLETASWASLQQSQWAQRCGVPQNNG